MPTVAKKKTMPEGLNKAIKVALKAMTKAEAAATDADTKKALNVAGNKLAAACVDAGGGAEYPG